MHLLACQVKRRNLRSADQQHPLRFLHDLDRIALQVSGEIETQRLVVAAHEFDQVADLGTFDAQTRIHAAGVQHVQRPERSDKLRPQILVDMQRVFDGVDAPPKPRRFVFDKPFLLYLKESQADEPYLVMWIANAEFMERVK